MGLRFLPGFFLSFVFAVSVEAKVTLYEWAPGNTLAPLILPVRDSETPKQAAQRYLRELSKKPELVELFEGRLPVFSPEDLRPLSDEGRETRALMIANNPRALQSQYAPLEGLMKIFGGQNSYLLPMNADLGLSRLETLDFFRQISERFPLLVPMGGDDVDPHFYKERNVHARNLNPARDQFEIQLIKHYVAQEKGFVFGICRGSQLTAVALGYKLLQDVPFHKGHEVSHANDWHPIETKETRHNLLRSLSDATGVLRVNSLHHQSVVYHENGPLELAAQSRDGVTEATEFINGRGLLLQFHPELMNDALGERILRKVLQQKNRVMPARCSRVLF